MNGQRRLPFLYICSDLTEHLPSLTNCGSTIRMMRPTKIIRCFQSSFPARGTNCRTLEERLGMHMPQLSPLHVSTATAAISDLYDCRPCCLPLHTARCSIQSAISAGNGGSDMRHTTYDCSQWRLPGFHVGPVIILAHLCVCDH